MSHYVPCKNKKAGFYQAKHSLKTEPNETKPNLGFVMDQVANKQGSVACVVYSKPQEKYFS